MKPKRLTNKKYQDLSSRTRNSTFPNKMKEEDENKLSNDLDIPIKNKKRKPKENAWTDFLKREKSKNKL